MANALNPSIILAGQGLDVVGAMDAGAIAGQRANQFKQQNALNGYLQQNGAQVMNGDQNALNALAGFGMDGLNAAQGVQSNRLGMEQTRLGMDATRQNMQLATSQEGRLSRQEERQIAEHASTMSREQRAQEAAQIEQAVAQGLATTSPEQWDAVVGGISPDLVGQFDNREIIAGRYMSIADVLKRSDDRSGNGGGATEYGLTPQYGTDAQGNLVAIQFAKDGTSIQTPMPEGVALSRGIDKLDLGDSFQFVNTMTGATIGDPIPKNLETAAAATARGGVIGKGQGDAEEVYTSLASKMPGLETVVSELRTIGDNATYTTAGQLRDTIRREAGAPVGDAALARTQYIAMVDNQVLPMLKDTFGAAFTVAEGDSLRATLGDPNKSPEEKDLILTAFIEQKRRDIEAQSVRTGSTLGEVKTPSGQVRVYDPETGSFK